MIKKSICEFIIVLLGYFITVSFIIYFIYHQYHFEYFEQKTINLEDLRKQLVANLTFNKGTVMKIPKDVIETDPDTCDIKCGADDCIKMKEMKKNLTKCIECQKQKGKCFHSSIIGGNCDDCLEGEVPINCSDTRHYGCAPPHNIQSYDGSLPYFISVPSTELNSAFDKKCIFCWQFSDYI